MANQYTKKKDLLKKRQKKANRKATVKKYDASAKGKAATNKYNHSKKGKAARKKYKQSLKGKKTAQKLRRGEKAKLADEQYRKKRMAMKAIGDEQLFIHELWRGTVNNAKKYGFLHEHPKFNSFWALWVKQKKEFGYNCPYTGDPFTWIHWNYDMGVQRPLGNVSTDQLVPRAGYTRTKGRKRSNIVFCTYGANLAKRNLPPETMKMVVHIFENGLVNPNPKNRPTKEQVGITTLRNELVI